jgi:ComF family protein
MADAVLSVVVAAPCAVCDTLLEHPAAGPVCDRCWSAVRPLTPPLCPRCGEPLGRLDSGVCGPDCPRCRRRPSLIASSRAVGAYAGLLRTLIHLLKYDRRRSLARPLAHLMTVHGAAVLADADAVIPVPLHWRRQWRRGFNQAALLAEGVGLPAWPALVRTRATSSQVTLPAAARRRNVRGAFALARRWPWQVPWRVRIAGKTVVLVDDVATTGATLEACAAALCAAGAREVRALTAARVAN